MENLDVLGRVLLLSCSTGQGHNAAAKAVSEYLSLYGVASDTVDGLGYVSGRFARFLSNGHSLMYRRGPFLFQFGWGYSENHPEIFEEGTIIFKKLASGVERLYEAVVAGGYATVICTHALPAIMVTEMLKRHPIPLRTGFVSTDYTNYPCMHMTGMACNLIPHEALATVFARSGMPREKMVFGGIPVRRGFFSCPDKASAKRELGLDEHSRHLLIMGGSMGCGPMEKILARIVRANPAGVELTVICGSNRRLLNKLTKRYGDCAFVHIVGYCDNVPTYMAASELYLTKPGGISTSEAATVGLPMVLANTVAGCETYNLTYFQKLGGAVTADGNEALAEACLTLLANDEARARMEAALKIALPGDGAAVLCAALAALPIAEATPQSAN